MVIGAGYIQEALVMILVSFFTFSFSRSIFLSFYIFSFSFFSRFHFPHVFIFLTFHFC